MFGDLPFAQVGFCSLYEDVVSGWTLVNTAQVSNWEMVDTPSYFTNYIVTETPAFLVTEGGNYIITWNGGWTPVEDQQTTNWVDVDTN